MSPVNDSAMHHCFLYMLVTGFPWLAVILLICDRAQVHVLGRVLRSMKPSSILASLC